MEDKISRPKWKLKTSRKALELGKEIRRVAREIIQVLSFYDKYKDCPSSKEFREAAKLKREQYSVLQTQLMKLFKEAMKERFEAATTKNYDEVYASAVSDGDRNSWLLLLMWDIRHLNHNELITIIILAHQKRKPTDIRFLEEVARIIGHPREPHKNADRRKFNELRGLYDPSKTMEENLKLLTDEGFHVSDKYLRRIGLGRKDR